MLRKKRGEKRKERKRKEGKKVGWIKTVAGRSEETGFTVTRLKLLVSRRNTRKLTRADGQVKFGRRDGKGKNVTNWGTKGCCWRSTCRLEQPLDVPAPRPIARPSSFYPTSSLTHAPNARRLHLPVHLAVASQNPFLIYLFNFRPDYRDIGIRVESSRSIDHLLTRRIINQ